MKLGRQTSRGFRLNFLTKFALATFFAAVMAATALATVLLNRHTAALEADEGINAAGQVAQILTAPMAGVPRSGRLDATGIAALRAAEDAAKRLQFVEGIRIYRTDGSPLFPATASRDRIGVSRTIASGGLWSRNVSLTDGRSLRVQYLPFVTKNAIFVVAIDLSHQLMSAQMRSEATSIVAATAGAISLIFVSLVALAAGASRELELRRREAEETFVKTLKLLAEAIDRRDPYTAGHSQRVADYSRRLATELKLTQRERDVVVNAALLHDLGKIGIPDAVLLKPAKLDGKERAIINHHPAIGGEILSGVSTMGDIVPCVLHHHERIDGYGYPEGLAGDSIPVGARIIAVADTFDAMTTDRPYRRALSTTEAIAEMRRVSGTQLELRFVETFAQLVDRAEIVPPRPARLGESLANRFGPQIPFDIRVQDALEARPS